MSSPNTVMACRLCLATDIKLLEIEMGLKNSVKSMLGENIYYTSGLPSHVCFECAAHLRKYTKFRRKCRRVQTFLYGILKNNGEVTEEELKKINRKKLGLESCLSIHTVSSESFSEPTELIKEEVIDNELDLATEHDIDIKLEEPRIDETYEQQEYEDMPLVTDTKNIQCERSGSLGNQEQCTQQQFLDYMSTFGTGPYLKERKIKNQKTTESFRNSVNQHNIIFNEKGDCLFPNITLPVCTTITPVSPSQSIGCKKCLMVFTPAKFSEHVRYCEQDVDELHALKNLGLTILPEENVEIIMQDSDQVTNKYVATSNLKIDKPLLQVTVTEKKLQGLNGKYCKVKSKITSDKHVNEQKGTNNTLCRKNKSNTYYNNLQQEERQMIGDCTINKVTNYLKQKGKKDGDVNTIVNLKNRNNIILNTNIEKIDVNTYMEAIELLPFTPKLENQNSTKKNQVIGDCKISKIETLKNVDDMENDLKRMSNNVKGISKVSNTNNYINHINLKFDKAIVKNFNKGANLGKSNIMGTGIQIIDVKTENNIGTIGTKSIRVKKKRKRPYDSDDSDFTNQANAQTRKRRIKLTQRRWSKEEMEIVYRRFHTELDLKQNPGVVKCKLVLKEEPLLQGRTWMQLNSCVNNLYMKKVKSRLREKKKLEESGRVAEFHSNLTLPSQVLAMRKLPSGEL